MAKSLHQKDALHHVQDVQTIMHHVINDHDYARGKALHSPLQSTTMNDRAPWLVIVLSSDRGLCGTFNSHIQNRANDCVTGLTKANHTVQVACIGSVTLQNTTHSSTCHGPLLTPLHLTAVVWLHALWMTLSMDAFKVSILCTKNSSMF